MCRRWTPRTATSRCDESFSVNVAARELFGQFHDTHIEYEVMRKCADCKSDGYGYLQVCPGACRQLADDCEQQPLKDERAASLRDAWVMFLRHCVEHGGYTVSY